MDADRADADDRVLRWQRRWDEPVQGWDFSEFESRVIESPLPWAFEDLVREKLLTAGSALDLGTGGGEFLLSFEEELPVEVHATEGWEPNLPVARRALGPLGIEVREYDAERGDRLPYDDDSVDVALSRHEAYDIGEVVRVLREGGWLVTQQVDGRNLDDLGALFGGAPAYPDVTLEVFRAEAEQAGLIVEVAQEWSGPIRFDSVDTLVSYLRLMPWQLPEDFTVARYADTLLALDDQDAPLEFTERRFVLVAHLPIPEPPPSNPFPRWER